MIPYRFLSPAEEEMTEAALFYEAVSSGLAIDFLDDVQSAINRLRDYPKAGEHVDSDLRRLLLHRFPFNPWAEISERLRGIHFNFKLRQYRTVSSLAKRMPAPL